MVFNNRLRADVARAAAVLAERDRYIAKGFIKPKPDAAELSRMGYYEASNAKRLFPNPEDR